MTNKEVTITNAIAFPDGSRLVIRVEATCDSDSHAAHGYYFLLGKLDEIAVKHRAIRAEHRVEHPPDGILD